MGFHAMATISTVILVLVLGTSALPNPCFSHRHTVAQRLHRGLGKQHTVGSCGGGKRELGSAHPPLLSECCIMRWVNSQVGDGNFRNLLVDSGVKSSAALREMAGTQCLGKCA